MKTFTFCVDLDGVVGDYELAFKRVVARETGVPIDSIGPQTHWEFTNCAGWPIRDREQYLHLHQKAVQEGMFANMPFMDGVSDALWALSDAGVRIRVVTHRLVVNFDHEKVIQDTVSWLNTRREDNGKPMIPYRDICFVEQKSEVGGDLYVDDGPRNIEALRSAGFTCVVWDCLYNKQFGGPRVSNWNELKDSVMKHYQWLQNDPLAVT